MVSYRENPVLWVSYYVHFMDAKLSLRDEKTHSWRGAWAGCRLGVGWAQKTLVSLHHIVSFSQDEENQWWAEFIRGHVLSTYCILSFVLITRKTGKVENASVALMELGRNVGQRASTKLSQIVMCPKEESQRGEIHGKNSVAGAS